MLSVRSAIKSTQQRLKLFNQVPPNGLVVFVGTIHLDEGKEKKVSEHIVPPKPINVYVQWEVPRACRLDNSLMMVVQLDVPLRRQISYRSTRGVTRGRH